MKSKNISKIENTYLREYDNLFQSYEINQKNFKSEHDYWKSTNEECQMVANDINTLINNYIRAQKIDYKLLLKNMKLIKQRYYKVSKVYPKLVNDFYVKQSKIRIHPWDYSIFDISILNKIPRNKEYWGLRGINKLSEDQNFIDSLIKSYNENLIDLDFYSEKSQDSFSYYVKNKDLTYINIFPQGTIYDNIYFYHEIGHAFFNYLNHILNTQMTLKDLYESERMAYKFESKYARSFFQEGFMYYQYNFYSLMCMFAVKSAFEIYCYLHMNSSLSSKSEIYQLLVGIFTPWIYSEKSSKRWCMQREILETPFYDLAYFLSQSEFV